MSNNYIRESSKEHFNEWMKQINNLYYYDNDRMTEAYKKIQNDD